MKRSELVRTGISIESEVLQKIKERVRYTGQSVSSCINVLLRQHLGLDGKETPEKSVR